MTGASQTPASLATDLTCTADGWLRGFVVDGAAPATRFVVELLADGLPLALVRAQDYREDVTVGDGCYGFSYKLAGAILAHGPLLEARLANIGTSIGSVAVPAELAAPSGRGQDGVGWAGGLKLTGWLSDETAAASTVVKALVGGIEVARTEARSWRMRSQGGEPYPVRAFDLHLPADLARGRVVTVEVLSDAGGELPGSPCLVFALPDGFAELIDAHAEIASERPRARFADGLLPQSFPLAWFDAWQQRFPVPAAEVPGTAHVHLLIVGESGAEETLASLSEPGPLTWSASVVARTDSPASFASRHLGSIAAAAGDDVDLVVATVAGARFAAGALGHLLAAAHRFPAAKAFYPDVVRPDGDGREPTGFPAYDDERFLEQGYAALCFALRPGALAAAAESDCGSLFALFPAPLREEDWHPPALPVHLPMLLATLPRMEGPGLGAALREATRQRLARRGVTAEVQPRDGGGRPSVHVRRRIPTTELSILIAARSPGVGLQATLDALAALPAGLRTDIVIADGGCPDPAVRQALDAARRVGVTVIPAGATSNAALLFNRAAAKARGDALLCLAPGVVPDDADAIDELRSRLAEARTGAVGPLVLWPQGVVRQAGVVLGPKFGAVDRLCDYRAGEAGPDGLLRVAHQVSAIRAECLMVRRALFARLGGFGEVRYGTALYDIDFCLRLWEAGYRTVLTPHATVTRAGRSTLPGAEPELQPVIGREAATLRKLWRLAPGCDPFYSPWMTMDDTPYSGLAWPPVPARPRQPRPLGPSSAG